jgi:UDP-N-acetylglucosamine 2-epimerase (hydrolysing)
MIASGKNYLVIYPNNDHGSSIIINSWKSLENQHHFRVLPSLRFEYFLVALKYATFMIGNSSAGVREAPYYGIPSINIGLRQLNRVTSSAVINVDADQEKILDAIVKLPQEPSIVENSFGTGNSAQLFKESLESDDLWRLNHQKQFLDV